MLVLVLVSHPQRTTDGPSHDSGSLLQLNNNRNFEITSCFHRTLYNKIIFVALRRWPMNRNSIKLGPGMGLGARRGFILRALGAVMSLTPGSSVHFYS